MILEQADFWHWWILALLLVVLEVFAPGFFFLWLGIASGIVGALLLAFPTLPWEYQLLIFAVLSVGSILAWRSYQKKHPTQTDQPALNRRGEQYVGRVFTLDAPIVNGTGKIHVDDTTWKINGTDCDAGGKVKVVGVDGTILRVERL